MKVVVADVDFRRFWLRLQCWFWFRWRSKNEILVIQFREWEWRWETTDIDVDGWFWWSLATIVVMAKQRGRERSETELWSCFFMAEGVILRKCGGDGKAARTRTLSRVRIIYFCYRTDQQTHDADWWTDLHCYLYYGNWLRLWVWK